MVPVLCREIWKFKTKYLENQKRYLQMVNGVRLLFVGSFISDQFGNVTWRLENVLITLIASIIHYTDGLSLSLSKIYTESLSFPTIGSDDPTEISIELKESI